MAKKAVTTCPPLRAGMLGVDTSGFHLDPAQLVKDGGAFGIRYSAGKGNTDPNTQWKLTRIGEIAAFEKAGAHFVANSEWYADRVEEGHTAGLEDGVADRKFWRSRGLNKGATIYVSYDQQPDRSKYGAIEAYFRGYRQGLTVGKLRKRQVYEVGAYGGSHWLIHLKAKGLVKHAWRTNAGAWSNDGLPYQPDVQTNRVGLVHQFRAATQNKVEIAQTGNYWYRVNGVGQADEDMLLYADIGSHQQAARRVKPKPPPVVVPPAPKPPTPPTPRPPQHTPDSLAQVVVLLDKLAARVTALETTLGGK